MMYILNGDNSTSTHAIGMCNTSSESSHWGCFCLKISSLLMLFLLSKRPTTFLLKISMYLPYNPVSPMCTAHQLIEQESCSNHLKMWEVL